ncbi:hypothetical protein D3C72_1127840 [compost metagenome]
MQQDDIARLRLRQSGVQRLDIGGAVSVEMGIGLRLQAYGLDQRQVGRPGRRADPDMGAGIGLGDQLQRQTQGAGAARRLYPRQSTRSGGLQSGEGRVLKSEGEFHVARGADIALGGLRVQDRLLGCLHRRHDRNGPALVAIGADAEVDLVGARVGLHQQAQLHQGVGARGRQTIKHGLDPGWERAPGRSGASPCDDAGW